MTTRSIPVLLACVVATIAVALPRAFAKPRPVDCGTLSIGPSAFRPASKRGAGCLLRAYRQHCRPASYVLDRFGVDTVATSRFRVVVRGRRCEIAVASSFRVVPQQPHPTGHGYCATLRARGTDVVAADCTGIDLPRTISLTGR